LVNKVAKAYYVEQILVIAVTKEILNQEKKKGGHETKGTLSEIRKKVLKTFSFRSL
jgi:hypothetical protein